MCYMYYKMENCILKKRMKYKKARKIVITAYSLVDKPYRIKTCGHNQYSMIDRVRTRTDMDT